MEEISDNLLSAFLDGNASAEEIGRVIRAAKNDPTLAETIRLANATDLDVELSMPAPRILPYAANVASGSANRCAMLCELHVLRNRGIHRSPDEWQRHAERQGWLNDDGTPLHNIGRMLELECFSTARTFHNSIASLKESLDSGADVIAVVNQSVLSTQAPNKTKAHSEEDNHAIVVKSVDDKGVRCYEPNVDSEIHVPTDLFLKAWSHSQFFKVAIRNRDYSKYEPHPIDLTDVQLPHGLDELCEAIAENAHEVWAAGRKAEGWTYGEHRDDKLRTTPDMVPYSDLPDSEKEYDRSMAMNTLRLLTRLGYRITKY